MYFNYHAKVKRLIKEGKAISYDILDSYHGISPCLLIYFKNNQSFPIRLEHFDEYIKLLNDNGIY